MDINNTLNKIHINPVSPLRTSVNTFGREEL